MWTLATFQDHYVVRGIRFYTAQLGPDPSIFPHLHNFLNFFELSRTNKDFTIFCVIKNLYVKIKYFKKYFILNYMIFTNICFYIKYNVILICFTGR